MNYNKSQKEKTAGVIRYSCGILFSLFSFCYLYFIQGEILAQAQHVYSNGITRYSILIGAIIITGILLCLQWLVSYITQLSSTHYAWSYIPSALVLAILTDVDEEAMMNFSFGPWLWIAPLVIILYALLIIGIKKFGESGDIVLNYNIRSMLYPNYIILFFTMLAVGAIPHTSDVYHFELKTERLILEGKYEEASKVGEKSLRTSARLTELRMYALSMMGQLPEKIFEYPQYDGKDGLLILNDTMPGTRLTSKWICHHLGAVCGNNIRNTDRYFYLVLNDTLWNEHTADYYLCNLLLEKKLQTFFDELPVYYNLSDTLTNPYDSLPKAFKEALIIMSNNQETPEKIVINGDSIATIHDTVMINDYIDYCHQKVGISNERERINKTHRSHGKTFWWYYDFSDKAEGELAPRKKKS